MFMRGIMEGGYLTGGDPGSDKTVKYRGIKIHNGVDCAHHSIF